MDSDKVPPVVLCVKFCIQQWEYCCKQVFPTWWDLGILLGLGGGVVHEFSKIIGNTLPKSFHAFFWAHSFCEVCVQCW